MAEEGKRKITKVSDETERVETTMRSGSGAEAKQTPLIYQRLSFAGLQKALAKGGEAGDAAYSCYDRGKDLAERSKAAERPVSFTIKTPAGVDLNLLAEPLEKQIGWVNAAALAVAAGIAPKSRAFEKLGEKLIADGLAVSKSGVLTIAPKK